MTRSSPDAAVDDDLVAERLDELDLASSGAARQSGRAGRLDEVVRADADHDLPAALARRDARRLCGTGRVEARPADAQSVAATWPRRSSSAACR